MLFDFDDAFVTQQGPVFDFDNGLGPLDLGGEGSGGGVGAAADDSARRASSVLKWRLKRF